MEEKLYFNNSKGNKLCGILSNPNLSISTPIIILCHGFSTTKNAHTSIKLQEIINQNNVSTFRFDFFGHGESEGKFEDITISEAVDDTLNAIKLMKKLGYTKIGLFGSSFGGITALMTASKIKDLSILILKSPVSNFQEIELERKSKKELDEWKSNGFTYYIDGKGIKHQLNYTFFEDFKNNDGYEAAKKIKIPTLIIHGDADEIVPIKQSQKTVNIIKNCRLEVINGANHKYSEPKHFEMMLEFVSRFIMEHF